MSNRATFKNCDQSALQCCWSIEKKTALVLIAYIFTCDLLELASRLPGLLVAENNARQLIDCHPNRPNWNLIQPLLDNNESTMQLAADSFGSQAGPKPQGRTAGHIMSKRSIEETIAMPLVCRQAGRELETVNSSPHRVPAPNDNNHGGINESLERLTYGPLNCAQEQLRQQREPQREGRKFRGLWSVIGSAEAIRLIRIEAPSAVQAGQQIRLRCLYETKGDKLQSLSWYRNGREFYRYQPFERRQPVLAFNMTGILVDISRSKNNTVYLVNTTTETSGRFRCEATGTTFQEANLQTYIEVLPASSSGAGTDIAHTSVATIIAATTFTIASFICSHKKSTIK